MFFSYLKRTHSRHTIFNGAKRLLDGLQSCLSKKKNTVMEEFKDRKSLFCAISINRITAERFRIFSKKIAHSHSATLDDMMDFFEVTRISPRNKLMRHHLGLCNYIISRMDYIISLLREQDQKYHKPIYEMLAGLIKQAESMEAKKRSLVEKNVQRLTRKEWELEDGKVLLEDYNLLKDARQNDREDFKRLLSRIINGMEKVNPTFGKPFYKININMAELVIMQRRYQ